MSVIIVGGGMTGSTLALAISSLTAGKLPVTLIEASRPEPHKAPEARALALAQGSCQQLQRIGIWSALSGCATAITRVQVSDRGHAGLVNLRAEDYAIAALGQVIELHEAGRHLFALLDKAAGVTLCCPDRVAGVTRTQSQVTVTLDSGKTLQGQLMIAADGSSSPLANLCHIHSQVYNYQQVAVTATLTTARHPAGCAFERFTHNGPLALLPLSQGRSSLVWCHRLADHQTVAGWDDAHFLQQLQQAFGWRLGKILKVETRHSYPLRLVRASTHISHRLALVGNAAQTLHPIAGQGFNLALRDAISLAELLAKAAERKDDVGAWPVLSHYQECRRTDQHNTVNLTDGLISLFANHHQPLVAGRNLALMVMERLPLLRAMFARRALGWIEH